MWDKRYVTPLYGGCDPKRDFPRLLTWVEQGQLDIESMVSCRYTLEELGTALAGMLAGRGIKSVLRIAA
jgi:S-(hydroxymethyl)glutathione dehydrogenase/alcohol dehydrogenase